MKAVGCDGRVVNTGSEDGIISQLEISVRCILQKFVYYIQIFYNYAIYCNIWTEKLLDKMGTTEKYEKIEHWAACNKLWKEKTERIFPTVAFNEFTTDRRYLYEMCNGISNGNALSL